MKAILIKGLSLYSINRIYRCNASIRNNKKTSLEGWLFTLYGSNLYQRGLVISGAVRTWAFIQS